MKLHQELGDIKESLRHLHFDSNTSAIGQCMENQFIGMLMSRSNGNKNLSSVVVDYTG